MEHSNLQEMCNYFNPNMQNAQLFEIKKQRNKHFTLKVAI